MKHSNTMESDSINDCLKIKNIVKCKSTQASYNGGNLSLRSDVSTMLIQKKIPTMRLQRHF
jgi:hypothetical protein